MHGSGRHIRFIVVSRPSGPRARILQGFRIAGDVTSQNGIDTSLFSRMLRMVSNESLDIQLSEFHGKHDFL